MRIYNGIRSLGGRTDSQGAIYHFCGAFSGKFLVLWEICSNIPFIREQRECCRSDTMFGHSFIHSSLLTPILGEILFFYRNGTRQTHDEEEKIKTHNPQSPLRSIIILRHPWPLAHSLRQTGICVPLDHLSPPSFHPNYYYFNGDRKKLVVSSDAKWTHKKPLTNVKKVKERIGSSDYDDQRNGKGSCLVFTILRLIFHILEIEQIKIILQTDNS